MRWLIAALFVSACGPRVDPSVPEGNVPPNEAAAAGKALYDKYCKLCHAEGGQGYAADHASQLANPEFLRTAHDGFLLMAIDQGRPGTPMSAFGDKWGGPLSFHDERKIVFYLRSLGKEPIGLSPDAVAGDPAAGAAAFGENCARCHGDKAQGKTALSLSNPVFLMSASDAFLRYAIEHGRPGTPMPAFGDKLPAATLDNLTAYLRTLARNVESAPPGELPPSFDHAVIHPDGPDPEFPELGEGRYVPAAAVKTALDRGAKLVLLDARPTSDWLNSHIPGALPVPYYDPDRMTAKLPKDGTWIVAYCGCPHAASGKVMDALREHGYPKTAVIDEGIFEWIRRGYPITYGRAQVVGAPQ